MDNSIFKFSREYMKPIVNRLDNVFFIVRNEESMLMIHP